jgi:TolA-binding protein
MQYKDKGFGVDYTDNQRRAELLFQEILTKYPQSDKIADVAYQLGDIYESKAYRMYYRAVEYYQRCYQWNPKTTHEARIRAARIYDKQLHNRNRAIELYREVTTHETDPRRIQEAQKRIAELSATK